MADTENNAASSKLGFLPKLMLWSLVLLFGYLYLGAVERHGGSVGTAPADMADGEASVVSSSPPAAVSATAEQPVPTPVSQPAPSAVAATSAPAAPAPAAPTPVRAPVAAPAPASVSAPVSAKAPAAPSVPAAAPGPIVGASSEEPEHEVSKAEAQAFAHAVMRNSEQGAVAPESAPTQSTAPQAMQQPTPRGPAAPSPSTVAPTPQMPMAATPQPPMPMMPPPQMVPQIAPQLERPAAAAPSANERPAATGAQRAMSDYEAMRRQAMEEARQRWEQAYRMRPPAPAPYYGYPGYYRVPAPAPAPAPQQRD